MEFTYNVDRFRVIDGDSVECKLILSEISMDLGFYFGLELRATRSKINCRVNGIDAPEIRTDAGKAVAQVVCDWFNQEKQLFFISKKLDKFGRALGAFTDGENDSLSDFLLDHGLARPYDGGKRGPWSEEKLRQIVHNCERIKI